jgi:putative transposase
MFTGNRPVQAGDVRRSHRAEGSHRGGVPGRRLATLPGAFHAQRLAVVPKGYQEMVASIIRTIFAQPDGEHIEKQFREVTTMLGRSHPKVAAMLTDAQPDLHAFAGFPRRHWRQIWSTNPLERVNKEIKRRTDVVGVFPSAAALLRLAGSVLIEQHDEWKAGERRYFSEASMLELATMNTPVGVIDEAVILPELAAA